MERDIVRDVRKYAIAYGLRAIKINLQGNRGWPDYLFLSNDNRYAWIEFKDKGEEPDPLQVFRIAELKRRKCNVCWTDNYEQATAFLDATLLSDPRDEADA